MRKSLCMAVLLFCCGRGPAMAWEYLSEPESLSTPVFITHDPVRLSITPQGFGSGSPPFWVIGSELRDATFPTQQFPNFFFPQDFEVASPPCPGGGFGGFKCPTFSQTLTARNPAASVSFSSPPHESLSFRQDTTSLPVSCSAEVIVAPCTP